MVSQSIRAYSYTDVAVDDYSFCGVAAYGWALRG